MKRLLNLKRNIRFLQTHVVCKNNDFGCPFTQKNEISACLEMLLACGKARGFVGCPARIQRVVNLRQQYILSSTTTLNQQSLSIPIQSRIKTPLPFCKSNSQSTVARIYKCPTHPCLRSEKASQLPSLCVLRSYPFVQSKNPPVSVQLRKTGS